MKAQKSFRHGKREFEATGHDREVLRRAVKRRAKVKLVRRIAARGR